MIRFRDFRKPPYSTHEVQIVLHAICNLLHVEFNLKPFGFDTYKVSGVICCELYRYGVHKKATGSYYECSCLLQDLIDIMCDNNVLTIQDIKKETIEVEKKYPPVFYPPMQ